MKSLVQQLSAYASSKMYSFHTPGHKGRKDLLAALVLPDYDLTELPGLDVLHNPQGVIAEAQNRAARAYGADETYFLVNGATSGNQAMLMSLAPTLEGKPIRIERSAHRSVSSGMILSGIVPEYVQPIIHPGFNLPLGFDKKKLTENITHIGAWHLTSPTYYGTIAPLKDIIQVRDQKAPHIPICVDQAHGSHYQGRLFPHNAVTQGADFVVHSTHKTMNALTQAAMLHVIGERVDRIALRKALELLLTSSPNYLLLASLENAIRDLETDQVWDDLHDEVTRLQHKLEGSLRILTDKDTGSYGICGVDWSKILVNVSSLELNASETVQILRSSYHIEPELWDEDNILFMLGTGSQPQEIRVLGEALVSIVHRYSRHSNHPPKRNRDSLPNELASGLPPMHLTPRQAWFAPKRTISIRDCLGQISGETISVYPPGIPLVVAGEEITPDIQYYLLRADQYNWQGWQGFNREEILVVKG